MTEQGSNYAAFVESELKSEYDRRAALDARALALVTTTSSFVALVGAVAVFVLGKDHRFTPGGGRAVALALALLCLAVLVGLIATASREYQVSQIETLDSMLIDHWGDDDVDSRNTVAMLRVETIRTLRAGNNAKASLLLWAGGLQMAGLSALITAVLLEMRDVL